MQNALAETWSVNDNHDSQLFVLQTFPSRTSVPTLSALTSLIKHEVFAQEYS